jgi:hypothetical protein
VHVIRKAYNILIGKVWNIYVDGNMTQIELTYMHDVKFLTGFNWLETGFNSKIFVTTVMELGSSIEFLYQLLKQNLYQ